jgi:hypothetical protein
MGPPDQKEPLTLHIVHYSYHKPSGQGIDVGMGACGGGQPSPQVGTQVGFLEEVAPDSMWMVGALLLQGLGKCSH